MKDVYIVIYKKGNYTRVSSECYSEYNDVKEFCLSRGAEEVTPVIFKDSEDPTIEYQIKVLKLKEVR